MGKSSYHYLVFETAGGFCGIAWTDAGSRAFSSQLGTLPRRSEISYGESLVHNRAIQHPKWPRWSQT